MTRVGSLEASAPPVSHVGLLLPLVALLGGVSLWHAADDLALLTVAAWGGTAIVAIAPLLLIRSPFDWAHPVVFTSLMLLLQLIRQSPVLFGGLESHAALPGDERIGLTRLLAAGIALQGVAQLAYLLGFRVMRAPTAVRARARRAPVTAERVAWVVIVSCAVGSLAFILARGGLVTHFVQLGLGRATALSGNFWLVALLGAGSLAWLGWLAHEPAAIRLLRFWLAGLLAAPIGFLLTGSRSSVLAPIATVVLLHLVQGGRLQLRWMLLAGLGFLTFVGAGAALRQAVWEGGQEATSVEADVSPVDAFLSGLAEGSQRATSEAALPPILARTGADVSPRWGRTYLSVPSAVVPRALWPGKPSSVDGQTGRAFFGVEYGRPPGGLGEAYWNFGLAGVVAVFALFGAFHRWLLARLGDGRSPALRAVFAATLWHLATPNSSAVVVWLLALVPLAGVLLMIHLVDLRAERRQPVAGAA